MTKATQLFLFPPFLELLKISCDSRRNSREYVKAFFSKFWLPAAGTHRAAMTRLITLGPLSLASIPLTAGSGGDLLGHIRHAALRSPPPPKVSSPGQEECRQPGKAAGNCTQCTNSFSEVRNKKG